MCIRDSFRVVQEIAVDGKAVLGLPGLRPLRHDVQRTVTLLQEDDVRNDLGTCVLFESVIGQMCIRDSPHVVSVSFQGYGVAPGASSCPEIGRAHV